jgi:hypothetical protein
MNQFLVGLVAFSLISDVSLPEFKTGSLSIIYFAGDKVIVVSDSRVIFSRGRTTLPPVDNYCKLLALGTKTIFTSVHALDRPAGILTTAWNARTEAEKAFKFANSLSAASDLQKFTIMASKWSEAAKNHFTQELIFSPSDLDPDQGRVSEAVFVTVTEGRFYYASIAVTYDGHAIGIERNAIGATQDTLAIGKVDLVPKYLPNPPHLWDFSSLLLKTTDIRTLRMIKAVDMVEASDPNGTVGGAVDAVELWRDGTIHWAAHKENCQDDAN